ncbi:MAG: DUF4157 domain-containing protein [Rhizonema sp. NSF051]|nr:DUF4157 domain-containing protein [Rhizonema sp. NSF051]
MAYERVQKSFGQSSSKKKHKPIVPPLIDQQTQADSKLSPKVKLSSIPSKEERDAIRKSLFEKWGNATPSSIVDVRTHIQAKLTIGAPGDKYEQEADRVASLIVNQINAPVAQQESHYLQREEKSEEDELQMKSETKTIQREDMLEEELQMKPILQLQSGEGGMVATSEVETSIQQARGSGQPLADNIRKPMEQAFGADFSRVKVHTDRQSDQLNRSIQARAFTTGRDVFFRQGEYQPGSHGGQELVAHELTHVVQQNSGAVQRSPLPAQQHLQHLANVTKSTSGGDSSRVNLEKYKNDALVVKEFVTAEHKKAISNYCKKMNVILSVRDTGKLSLDRLQEGAKPKPHTILEKSIKESSLAKAHPEAAAALKKGVVLDVPLNIGGVSLDDLKGFVGHWNEDTGELLGVRVAPKDVELGEEEGILGLVHPDPKDAHSTGIRKLQPFIEDRNTDKPYIPLSKFAEFCAALPGGKWKHFLYTGDYDLHEVYKHNKALVEGSKDKARVLTGINQQIAKDQGDNGLPLREGKLEADEKTVRIGSREVPASTIHADAKSNYAMIQHGDQMGYITNQIHEGRLKQETRNNKAQLVGAVAEESPAPLAWCVRGLWYVTKCDSLLAKYIG